jgi:hypothetical protein
MSPVSPARPKPNHLASLDARDPDARDFNNRSRQSGAASIQQWRTER